MYYSKEYIENLEKEVAHFNKTGKFPDYLMPQLSNEFKKKIQGTNKTMFDFKKYKSKKL